MSPRPPTVRQPSHAASARAPPLKEIALRNPPTSSRPCQCASRTRANHVRNHPEAYRTHANRSRKRPDAYRTRANHIRNHPDASRTRANHIRNHPDASRTRANHIRKHPDSYRTSWNRQFCWDLARFRPNPPPPPKQTDGYSANKGIPARTTLRGAEATPSPPEPDPPPDFAPEAPPRQ